ncbi:hypothetical protein [Mesorhizobium sp. M8A.F.Ca.ET.021.01.1.1]|uniref:hypothetical protein n=1 Tax=Mesorhizobium sp. M8A.F.Ca.ET.021.01.1.1 TaxID=2496757 RepID=UPI000FCC7F40|nr:hypothetical protein [Mesorhizobium sp. M8A.F.Ca.ET.021.01.1.1]RUW56379.1 hypothetical protein EOA36_04530 [Mesorhizobium sp. M8A.F.Ca.ET.021.01.1.1]
MDKPTIREAFERAIHCVRCGARRDLDDEDQMYAIEEVVERIERLEGLVLSDKKEHPSVVIVPENPDVRRERLGRTFFAISALIPVKEGLEEGQTYSVHVKDGGTTVNFNGVRAVRNGFDWFLNLRSASSYSIQPSMEIEFV